MKSVKVYQDPKQFWIEISPFLKAEEAKNSLCLGLAYEWQTSPRDCLYQSSLFENGRSLGALVVGRFSDKNLMYLTPVSDPSAARALFDEFQAARIPVAGLIGETETAGVFKELLESFGWKLKVIMTEGIYRCDSVKIPEHHRGLRLRQADDRDLGILANWIAAFHLESVPYHPKIDGEAFAKDKIGKKMIYVLEDDGQLVSMAAWSRDIGTSCSIGLVYTPGPLRNRGYGSLATAMLTQHLLESGKRETNLYVDVENFTANEIYVKVGYKFVCKSVYLEMDF